jgi:hypothetical protein
MAEANTYIFLRDYGSGLGIWQAGDIVELDPELILWIERDSDFPGILRWLHDGGIRGNEERSAEYAAIIENSNKKGG